MCKVLNISRSLIYYKYRNTPKNTKLENMVIKIFKDSRNNYGARKIKAKLKELSIKASRRKIGRIMLKYGLVSNYTVRKYKAASKKCNKDTVTNILDRNFNENNQLGFVVSDLTYMNSKTS